MGGSRGGLTRRQMIAGSLAALLTVGVGVRIWCLNANHEGLEVVEHEMGEWVELDGAFCDMSRENTKGYSMRVSDAQIMSYNEYVEAYANDDSQPEDGLDTPCLAVLTIDIRNEEHVGEGGLNLFEMFLIPARGNFYYIEDAELFLKSEAKLREAGTNGWHVSIKEGTEYQIHLPYILNDFRNRYTTEMTDREFSYYISNLPVRHSIRVEAV